MDEIQTHLVQTRKARQALAAASPRAKTPAYITLSASLTRIDIWLTRWHAILRTDLAAVDRHSRVVRDLSTARRQLATITALGTKLRRASTTTAMGRVLQDIDKATNKLNHRVKTLSAADTTLHRTLGAAGRRELPHIPAETLRLLKQIPGVLKSFPPAPTRSPA
ncbi:MAG: hypothetical protein ACRDNL_28480 [Spirillospora sp.]